MYRNHSAHGLRALLLIGVSAVSLTAAQAADMYSGGLKDSPAYVPYNWTGFYAGMQSGAAVGTADVHDPYGNAIFGDSARTAGGFTGGQIGYNYQFGRTVAGIEAEANWADLEGTTTCFGVSGLFLPANCGVHVNSFGTLTARLGQTLGPDERTLVYAKGGAAWENRHVNMILNNFDPVTATSSDQTNWGWTAGAGVEYGLTPRWSVRFEYDYMNFGTGNATSPNGGFVDTPTGLPVRISQDLHSFLVGVNYRPNGAGAPWELPGAPGSLKDPMPSYAGGWGVEVGTRYMYSWGRFQKDMGLLKTDPVPASDLISRLTYDGMHTNSGELFARIDTPSSIFVKGLIGTGSTFDGKMNDEDFNIGGALQLYSNTLSPKVDGDIQYGIIDVGYDFLHGRDYKVGSFVGGGFFNQSMKAFGCAPIAAGNCIPNTPTSGSPSITEDDKWAALRIGSVVEIMLSNRLKLTGEAAYLPYVSFTGTDHHYFGNTGVLAETFPESANGGQGAQIEAMLSYAATEHWNIGVGGRYWAMWTKDGAWNCTFGCPGVPTAPQHFKAAAEQAGVLGQLSYKFGGAYEPLPSAPLK